MEEPSEIRRLQGCINDLVSLLALPAMWRGRGPTQVVDRQGLPQVTVVTIV